MTLGSEIVADFAIIMTIAAIVTYIFHRLKQPLILGYLVAGVIIGPYTPPFSLISRIDFLGAAADMGVILLLFAIGLEFPLARLRTVGKVSIGVAAIEIAATPEGVVGKARSGTAHKAKRPMAAILKYLTMWHDDVLEAFPAGKVPPVEEVTLRTAKEMEPYLRKPLSEGWKPVYGLPRIGQGTEV